MVDKEEKQLPEQRELAAERHSASFNANGVRWTNGSTMRGASGKYKGCEYRVVQSASPREWKWTVFFDGNGRRTGISRNRSVAILDALRAIQKAKKDARKANKPSS
jgi:hypothetical protein